MKMSKSHFPGSHIYFSFLFLVAANVPMAFSQFQQDKTYNDQITLSPVALDKFYDESSEKLVWENNSNSTDLISAIQSLEDHGLNPIHYHLELLQEFARDTVKRDRLATDAWFAAAAHMLYGKLDPISVEPDWTAARREANLADFLRAALANGTIADSLNQFAPKQHGYALMVAEYAQLKAQNSIPIVTISAGAALRQGMTGDRVSALQSRLVQLTVLDQDLITKIMDSDTVEAVKLFQEMMNLDDDGIVGAATLAALNRSEQDKLNQLRVNMERWRWLPDDLGSRHVRVNIAAFDVTAWNDGVMQQSHLAIVGKNYRRTPVFSDQIEYIIFNPWWEVPASIARNDKLPLFRQNPALVTDLGFQVKDRNGIVVNPETIDWNEVRSGSFPYQLRQSPGDQNALGQVKIIFPNSHNVYIHDTPTRGLFAQRQRAFSSGCIRTQDPLDIAAWLLSDNPNWTRMKIDEAVTSGLETRVNLTSRIPVHVLYFTVVSEERGGVRFLDDIYQRDDAVLAGLRSSPH
ncbi:MAG: murein L,D-transpeptidase YcbB/YkuD [Lysobacterales bacterium]